jgi:hypothetical protein
MSDEPQNASPYYLLPGVGVVIDDQIDTVEGGDAIHNLVAQLEKHAIPLVKFKQLPDDETIEALSNVGFILLDWELFGRPEAESGEVGKVSLGEALEAENRKQIIAFLKKLKASCFSPVFIFSNLGTEYVRRVLKEEEVRQDPDPGAHIFVHAKVDLKTDNPAADDSPLLKRMSEWIASHPSLYVLSRWRRKMDDAQTSLFWDLFEASPGWPRALWNASKEDGDNPDYALADILMRSMKGEMEPLGLDENLVLGSGADADQAELRAILERTTMIPNTKLPPAQYGCGDMFRGVSNNFTYYRLNIRCDCDCIAHDGGNEDVQLYLIKARLVTEDELKSEDVFSITTGFQRPMNLAYVFPVDQGKCLAIRFQDFIPISVKKLHESGMERIGRLTSPHLTDIRHRYSNWLHREGFPKIPVLAVRAV